MVIRGALFPFWLILGIGSLVVVIITAIDASKHPDWAWQRVGKSKTLWIVLPIVLLFACGIVGGIMGLVYLLSVKPSLVAAEQQGPPPGWGGPPGGYGQPGYGQPGWGAPPPPSWGQPPQPPQQPWDQPPPPPPPGS